MANINGHKNYTSNGDPAAENLLDNVLAEIGCALQSSGLSIYLGGSYGRGEGGVRQDVQNGILYNDLDFFAFARKKDKNAAKRLHEISEKYEAMLKVDVDFSRVMTVRDIRNNASRLMMQELKRGYRLVCGEDLLAEYLPEMPAENLPFSEACRLLLNRGMGLRFAEETIAAQSDEADFILRNINKAILGAGDALLLAEGRYRWRIAERMAEIEKSDLPAEWKKFYAGAVAFKSAPHRNMPENPLECCHKVREFFRASVLAAAGTDTEENFRQAVWEKCVLRREVSMLNYIKYCVKTRKIHRDIQFLQIPPVVTVLCKLLDKDVCRDELYHLWLKFN